MNSELQSQTDLLLKALDTVHTDLQHIYLTDMIVASLLFAILLVIALRRHWS